MNKTNDGSHLVDFTEIPGYCTGLRGDVRTEIPGNCTGLRGDVRTEIPGYCTGLRGDVVVRDEVADAVRRMINAWR